jgi:hypothetical protein
MRPEPTFAANPLDVESQSVVPIQAGARSVPVVFCIQMQRWLCGICVGVFLRFALLVAKYRSAPLRGTVVEPKGAAITCEELASAAQQRSNGRLHLYMYTDPDSGTRAYERHGASPRTSRFSCCSSRSRRDFEIMTSSATADSRFQPGSLVRTRGREWITLSAPAPWLAQIAPGTGAEQDS